MLRDSPLAMPLAGSNLPHSVVEEGIIHRFPPPDPIEARNDAPYASRHVGKIDTFAYVV